LRSLTRSLPPNAVPILSIRPSSREGWFVQRNVREPGTSRVIIEALGAAPFRFEKQHIP
jgi:hypothetical protein